MVDLSEAPRARYLQYCRDGKLAYQVCGDTGKPVFYPRAVSPYTGSANLTWKVSSGSGKVYSWTTVHTKGVDPYNVSLIDLDEGFRMMSRVEGIEPGAITLGMRVEMRMNRDNPEEPYPVFAPSSQGDKS
jgi:uncharacterized OB-fold protein